MRFAITRSVFVGFSDNIATPLWREAFHGVLEDENFSIINLSILSELVNSPYSLSGGQLQSSGPELTSHTSKATYSYGFFGGISRSQELYSTYYLLCCLSSAVRTVICLGKQSLLANLSDFVPVYAAILTGPKYEGT